MASLENTVPATIERAPTLIREQVATYLRDAITSFKLRPGSTLVEREICQATSTSRATVREALRQLESEGLVVSEQGKGSVVRTLTRTDMWEIYDVRAVLEGLACRRFAVNATDEQIEDLRAVVAAMVTSVDDPEAMLKQKTVFYDALFAGAGNAELRRLVAGIRQRATLVRATSLSIPGRAPKSLVEIQALTDALAARDGKRAEKLAIAHIESAAQAILNASDSHFAPANDQS